MLKFQLATKSDLREAASIQHRQKFEDDRKSRIFNARNRIIGVNSLRLRNKATQIYLSNIYIMVG